MSLLLGSYAGLICCKLNPTQVIFCAKNTFFLGAQDEKDLVAMEARFFVQTNGPVPGDLAFRITVLKALAAFVP